MTFFNQTIEPEQMAKAIRQVNFVLALALIREHENPSTGNQQIRK